MKIAVLTFFYKQNYGGILQCLALQNTLKELGHDVDVIKFISSQQLSFGHKVKLFFALYGNMRGLRRFLGDKIKSFRSKGTLSVSQEMLSKCTEFISTNINYTQQVDEDTIGNIANNYDAIIVGSDMIWGGLGGKTLTYLFDWVPDFKGLRISYAACSHLNKVPSFNKKKIKDLLLKFDAISVRDSHTAEIVRETSGREAQIIADPTFMYGFDQYIGDPIIQEPYIFIYILGGEIKGAQGHQTIVDIVKEKYGNLRVVASVIPDVSMEASNITDDIYYDASPDEWLNLIYYATFVYTDSFHGAIFSLKFHKAFLAYYSYAFRASRLIGLNRQFNLCPCIVSSIDEYIANGGINASLDYSRIDKEVEQYIQISREFIVGALNTKSQL